MANFGRKPGIPQAAPTVAALVAVKIPRERAILAARVGELRHQRGWTRSQLATEAGVNQRVVTDIEKGTRDPQFSTLLKLARALNLCALDQLVGEMPVSKLF